MTTPRRESLEKHKPAADFAFDVRAEACELLALFLADKPVHKLAAQQRFEAIAQEYSEYSRNRIFKLLLEIATSYRLVSWRLLFAQKAKERLLEVGVIFLGDSDTDGPLSMHEACNKIIHAEEFAFDTRKIRNVPLTYIREDTLYASGKKGKQEWTACLWIPEFCDAALDMPIVGGLPW